jgi:uncharacterized protein YhaN
MRVKRMVLTARYKVLPETLAMEFPPRGLYSIVGPNEAGKSSLLELLRGVLFPEDRDGWSEGAARVEVELADGTAVTLERVGRRPRIWDGEGRVWTSEQWRERVGASAGLFRNVYGFGLAELETLASLDNQKVGTQLVSAGLGLRRDLTATISRLERGARELYTERGQKAPLNVALADIRRLRDRIRQLEGEQSRYAELLAMEAEQEAEAARRAEAVHDAEREATKLARMQEAWPKWVQYKGLLAEEAGLAALSDVAEDVGLRLQLAEEEVQRTRRQVDLLREKLAEQERQMPPPERLTALESPPLQGILEQAGQIDQWVADLERHRGQLEELAVAVDTHARRLGVAVERLREGFPAQVLRSRVEHFAQRLAGAAQDRASAERLVEERARQVAAAGSALDALADIPRRSTWEARRAQLAALAKTTARPAVGPIAVWLLVVLAAGSAAVTARTPATTGLAALAALAGLVGLVWRLRDQSRSNLEAWRAAGVETPGQLPAVEAAWEALASRVGERETQEARLAEARRDLDHAKAQLVEARAVWEQAEEEWRAFCADEGLPSLLPEAMTGWLRDVEVALADVARMEREAAQVQTLRETAQDFLRRAVAAADQVGLEVRDRGTLATWVALRREWRQLPELESRRREAESRYEEGRAELTNAERRLADILEELRAENLAEAKRLAADAARLRALRRQAMQLEAELTVQAGGAGLAAFESWDSRDIAEGVAEARHAVESARVAHREAEAALAATRRRLEDLERSGTLPELRLELAEAEARAVRLQHTWVVHRLALEALLQAHGRFRRERQPEVMRQASDLFAAFTAGRYSRVLADGDNIQDLQVERQDGALFRPGQLSRGTQEQLYLALRLAWIASRERQAEPLPLIFDDILVNADPSRQESMARALARLGKNRQVLYLTCHPDTVKLFRRLGAKETLSLA